LDAYFKSILEIFISFSFSLISKMSNKRNEYEICGDILAEARAGSVKTKLLHRVNLNVKSVSRYLDLLLRGNLIEVYYEQPSGRAIYRTTQKGKEYLEFLERLKELKSVSKKTEKG